MYPQFCEDKGEWQRWSELWAEAVVGLFSIENSKFWQISGILITLGMKATMLWIMSWSSGGTALRLTRVSINDELYREDEEENVTIMIIDDSDDLSRCWYWLSWGGGDIIVEILLQRVVFFCVGCGLLLYQSNYTTCKAPMNTDGKDDGGKNVTFQTYSLTCCREQHSYHQRRIHTEESSSKARRILKNIFIYYCPFSH